LGTEFITSFLIEPEWTEIEVPIVSGYIGDYVWLEAFLTDDEGNPIEGYLIDFYVLSNPSWQFVDSDVTDSNGFATVQWGPITTSVVYIKCEFAGDPRFYRSSTGEDHVKPLITPTALTAIKYWWGEDLIISGNLHEPGPEGAGISNQMIYISITKGTSTIATFYAPTNDIGDFSVAWSPISSGCYSIWVYYPGDSLSGYAGSGDLLYEDVSWDELIGSWILLGIESDGGAWNGAVIGTAIAVGVLIGLVVFWGYGDLWWGAGTGALAGAIAGTLFGLWMGTYGFSGIDLGVIQLFSIGQNTNEKTYNDILVNVFGANGLSDAGDKQIYHWGLPPQYTLTQRLNTGLTGVTRAAFIYIGPSSLSGSNHLILPSPYNFDFTSYVQTNPNADNLYFVFIDSIINPKDQRNLMLDDLHNNQIEHVICVGNNDINIPFNNLYTQLFFENQKSHKFHTVQQTLDYAKGTFDQQALWFLVWGAVTSLALKEIIPMVFSLVAWLGGIATSDFEPLGWMIPAVVGIFIGAILAFIAINNVATKDSIYIKTG